MQNDTGAKAIFVGNLAMFVVLGTVLLGHFTRRAPRVLSVERLSIVDSTGALALVLANGARLPGGTFAGKEYPQSFSGRARAPE